MALCSGALLGSVFSDGGLWWWAYVGLAPMLVAAAGSPGLSEALWRTWLAGVGFVGVVHHWLVGPWASS